MHCLLCIIGSASCIFGLGVLCALHFALLAVVACALLLVPSVTLIFSCALCITGDWLLMPNGFVHYVLVVIGCRNPMCQYISNMIIGYTFDW